MNKTVSRDQISIPFLPTLPTAGMGRGTEAHKNIDAKRTSNADA